LVCLCPLFRGGSEGVQRGFREGSERVGPLNTQSTPFEPPGYPQHRVDESHALATPEPLTGYSWELYLVEIFSTDQI